MKRLYLALPFFFIGCGLFPIDWDKLNKKPDNVDVVDKPEELFGLDTKIPGTIPSLEEARHLSLIAKEYSIQIKFDGSQPEPKLQNTSDVGRRFQQMNKYYFKGSNPIATEEFKKITADLFKKELESSGPVELTPELREKTCKMFEAISYSLTLKK